MKCSFFLIFLSLFLFRNLFCQVPGCTDPLAGNYNASATQNDGTCIYATANYAPVFICNLDSAIFETSGLIFFDGLLWTHNDSGNPNEIYQVDTVTGIVIHSVFIRNATNIDWESISQSTTHLFIGNFGNNNGDRINLSILKIAKTGLVNDTVDAETINFNYPDQINFSPAYNNHNFDCEAFIFANDSLHLFTKNWVDLQTRHYIIPPDSGTFSAIISDSFFVDGLITDAAINDSGTVILLGYKNIGSGFYTCFTWLLYDYTGTQYFSGNKRKIEIGNALQLGQTEGVSFRRGNSGWISSETIQAGPISQPAKLHSYNLDSFFSIPLSTGAGYEGIKKKLEIYPTNLNEKLTILNPDPELFSHFTLFNVLNRVVLSGSLFAGLNLIEVHSLENGIYFFRSNSETKKLIKN